MGCCHSKQNRTQIEITRPCRQVTVPSNSQAQRHTSRPSRQEISSGRTPPTPTKSRTSSQQKPKSTNIRSTTPQSSSSPPPPPRRSRSVRHQSQIKVRSPGGTTTTEVVPEDLSPEEAKRRFKEMTKRGSREVRRRRKVDDDRAYAEMRNQLRAIETVCQHPTSDQVIAAAFKAEEVRKAKNEEIFAKREIIHRRQEQELKRTTSEQKVKTVKKLHKSNAKPKSI